MVRAFALGVAGSAVMASLSRFGVAEAQERRLPPSAIRPSRTSTGHRQGHDQALLLLAATPARWRRSAPTPSRPPRWPSLTCGNMAGGFALEYVPLESGIAANNGGWDAGAESANANQAIADADCMVYMGYLQLGRGQDINPDHERRAGMGMISSRQHLPRSDEESPWGGRRGRAGPRTTRRASAITAASSRRMISRARPPRTGRTRRRGQERPMSWTIRASTVTASPRSSTTRSRRLAAKSSAPRGTIRRRRTIRRS